MKGVKNDGDAHAVASHKAKQFFSRPPLAGGRGYGYGGERRFTMHLFRVITYVLFLALAIPIHGCSTPDAGDMSQLEDTIDELGVDERSIVDRMRIADKIRGWLRSRPKNDKIGTMVCVDPTKWSDPKVMDPKTYTDYTVADLLAWLSGTDGATSYEDATDRFENAMRAAPEAKGFEACHIRWDFRYSPNQGHVPDDVMHPDTSARGLIEWLMASPAPPPGLMWTGGLVRLLPFLCALGAGWGCPADPFYPGPTTPGNAPPPSGDAP